MENKDLQQLAKVRAAVGFLGERDQFTWWQSSFFSASSQAFLAPVFPRTQLLAQISGITRAAAQVHDERIGTGKVYHLFRLPEDMEQDLHHLLQEPELQQAITAMTTSKEAALTFLDQANGAQAADAVGPTLVNTTETLRDIAKWQVVCTHYHHGFNQDTEIFPYFAD